MAHKDYYGILGLSNDASTDAIKKAYRMLAMQYHPDRNHGKEEWASEKFKEINEAFSVLGDSKKRRQYDHFGTAGNIDEIFGSHTTQTDFEDLLKDFDDTGAEFDLFDNIFGNDFRRRGFTSQRFKRACSESGSTTFETPGDINLEDLFEQIQSPKVPGVNYEIVLNKEQALKGTEKELVRKGKRLKVKIPAGVMMGSKIRLKDALKATDGKPGDIIINIKVQ